MTSPIVNQDSMKAAEQGKVVEALLRSRNPCDVRKGEDIRRLLELGQGRWQGRFQITDFAAEDRSLVVICEMHVPGLVWDGDAPREHGLWYFGVALAPHYPAAQPLVRFLKNVPFNPHVVSREHLPSMTGMPPELQEYIRNGNDGMCCYLRNSQWSPKESMGLPTVVAQLSRVLVGIVRGEAMSLNAVARDWMLRHADRLPLGNPLPWPSQNDWAATDAGHTTTNESPEAGAIDWIEEASA